MYRITLFSPPRQSMSAQNTDAARSDFPANVVGLTAQQRKTLRHLHDLGKTVGAWMPVTFGPSVKTAWTKIVVRCACCNRPIDDQRTLAEVSGGPCSVKTFEAVGICFACHRVSFFLVRLHPDGQVDGPVPSAGGLVWKIWRGHLRTPWWDLVGWAERIVRRFVRSRP